MSDIPKFVSREAKLFEAGDYPDKGVSVSETDLDSMVSSFNSPLPLHIEHQDQPLFLGFVTRIWRTGKALFGNVELTHEANALIESTGAKRLSIALSKSRDKLIEVSLVRFPRVYDAQLFHTPLNLIDGYADEKHEEEIVMSSTDEAAKWQLLEERLRRAEHRADKAERQAKAIEKSTISSQVDEKIKTFKLEGRLCPAAEAPARALLEAQTPLQFNDKYTHTAELFERFLMAQPPLQLFHETAPAFASSDPAVDLTQEELDYYDRHFPGIDLKKAAQIRKEDKSWRH